MPGWRSLAPWEARPWQTCQPVPSSHREGRTLSTLPASAPRPGPRPPCPLALVLRRQDVTRRRGEGGGLMGEGPKSGGSREGCVGSAEPLPEGTEGTAMAEMVNWTVWHVGLGRPVGFLGRRRRNLPRGGLWLSHSSPLVAVMECEGKARTSFGLAFHCCGPGTHGQVPLWLSFVTQKQGLPNVSGGSRLSRATAYVTALQVCVPGPSPYLRLTCPCSCKPLTRGILFVPVTPWPFSSRQKLPFETPSSSDSCRWPALILEASAPYSSVPWMVYSECVGH